MPEQISQPSPQLFFDTINAYQRTAALKAAIELDVFTAIGREQQAVQELAKRCGASERGLRILCDFLVVIGFLTKQGSSYGLTPESAMFLDQKSPAYLGTATEFLLSPMVTNGFKDVAASVRKGGTVMSEEGAVSPKHPMWVSFARAMAPMVVLPAQLVAGLVNGNARHKMKILDIAAGHGLYGLTLAQSNPNAEVTALDWPHVLEVAKENAQTRGVDGRYSTLPGSAFEVDYGSGYDVVLLTNFLHHFDVLTCEKLLKKVHAALNKGGRAVTLEFVPNEDRVSPPTAAAFSLIMLGITPGGDAYTFAEYERMFANSGFLHSELHPLPPTMQQVVISYK